MAHLLPAEVGLTSGKRWRRRGTVALVGVALGVFLLPVFESHQALVNSDWPAFATGGRLAASDPVNLYDLKAQAREQRVITGGAALQAHDEEGLLPFDMPPWVALLNAPFAALGTDVGARLWIVLELAALAAGLYLLAPPGRRVSALPGFAAVPTALAAINAQTDGLVILGIGAAWALWRRDHRLTAGLALGLCMVKPQLVLPLAAALLVTRSWRVLGGWAAATLALMLVTAMRDPRWLPEWPAFLAAHAGRVGTELGPIQLVWSSGLPRGPQVAAAATVVLLAITAVLLAARRLPAGPAAGTVVAGGLLAAPHALGSDLVLLPAALVLGEGTAWRAWVAVSSLALAAAVLKGTLGSPVMGIAVISLVLVQIGRRRSAPPAGL